MLLPEIINVYFTRVGYVEDFLLLDIHTQPDYIEKVRVCLYLSKIYLFYTDASHRNKRIKPNQITKYVFIGGLTVVTGRSRRCRVRPVIIKITGRAFFNIFNNKETETWQVQEQKI